MPKVKLTIDALQVESFETSGSDVEHRGTVDAHEPRTLAVSCYAGETCVCSQVSCVVTEYGPECITHPLDSCAVYPTSDTCPVWPTDPC